MKTALWIIASAASFLFLGWYGLVATLMAIIIRSSIPDNANQGQRVTATILWCALVSFVVDVGAKCPMPTGFMVSLTCMLTMAWPNRTSERPRYDTGTRTTLITEVDVIDV